jgi:hypothetical protein
MQVRKINIKKRVDIPWSQNNQEPMKANKQKNNDIASYF